MIVCTCDACGRVVDNWNTLNINLRGDGWHREICNDCYKTVKGKTEAFLEEITVTPENSEE